MKIDENEFFRKAAMEICGNLDIEKAMFHFLKFMRQYIPADFIHVGVTEVGLESLRRIAIATDTESRKIDELLPMPKKIVKMLKDGEVPDIRIVNDPEHDPIIRAMIPLANRSTSADDDVQTPDFWNWSYMVIFPTSRGRRLGTIGLGTQGKNRYTATHMNLFSLLNEPFAIALSNALRHREVVQLRETLRDDNLYLNRELLKITGDDIIGANFGLWQVMEMVRHIAPLNSPVVLLGETGVGKEVVANAIHNASPRKNRPFIKVNCGAIPDNLIDSELFGHEKGAFTGADKLKRGRFERADRGTLFLDEIGELPLPAQVRFLRALQNGEIERVGGTDTILIDVRIIAATNKDIQELVRSNQFREDLWFRLNVFPIIVPPLRARKEDIPRFLDHFIQRKSQSMGIHPAPEVGPDAVDRLMAYHWPGNVRELENIIERELVLSRGKALTFDHSFLPGNRNPRIPDVTRSVEAPLKLDEVISRHIRHVLKTANGRVNGPGGAADLLGVKSGALRYRMDKLGIEYRKRARNETVNREP